MDDIVKSKEMLFEIVDFFEKYKDLFTNSGFNDGYSEQYNFENLIYVKVFAMGEFSRKFKYGVLYNGDNELATISVDGSSSLDNEFIDEINEVINVYNEISESMEVFKNSMPLIEKETFLSEKIKDKKTKIKTKNS